MEIAALRARIILDIENLFMVITEICGICVISIQWVDIYWAQSKLLSYIIIKNKHNFAVDLKHP